MHVNMVREHLAGIPTYPLPAPYTLRTYRSGDEMTWVDLHLLADQYNTITPELFVQEFGTDASVLAQRMYFLCDGDGVPIGTATAWFPDDGHAQEYGRVHWVAILPQYQGKGLARPLLSTVCQRMRELGHTRAHLATDTRRIPALHLYLSFGFVPEIHNDQELQAWHDIRDKIREDLRDRLGLDG